MYAVLNYKRENMPIKFEFLLLIKYGYLQTVLLFSYSFCPKALHIHYLLYIREIRK